MKEFGKDFMALLFPELCKICNNRLMHREKFICTSCFYHLPEINYWAQNDNPTEKRFFGKFDIVHAYSLFRYVKDSDFHRLFVELKYRGCKELGNYLGEYFAVKMQEAGICEDINYLVPVPLHPKRYKKRGYNQSERIAQGITGILKKEVIPNNLYRKKANTSQTKKGVYERWENVSGIFALKNPEEFVDKHILLIDDVLTTGSTITACAETLSTVKNIQISVATLAIT